MLKRLTAALSKKDKDVHILVLGLDNSGKSSLIQHIKPKKYQGKAATYEATPTVNNLAITCFDMSGQSRYRSLWEHYYVQVEAIIFVVDSTDR